MVAWRVAVHALALLLLLGSAHGLRVSARASARGRSGSAGWRAVPRPAAAPRGGRRGPGALEPAGGGGSGTGSGPGVPSGRGAALGRCPAFGAGQPLRVTPLPSCAARWEDEMRLTRRGSGFPGGVQVAPRLGAPAGSSVRSAERSGRAETRSAEARRWALGLVSSGVIFFQRLFPLSPGSYFFVFGFGFSSQFNARASWATAFSSGVAGQMKGGRR